MKKKISKFLFIAYTVVVLLLSLLPSFIFMHMPYMPSFSFADKFAHMFMYFFYAIITGLAIKANNLKFGMISFPILYTAMFGILMEFCQMLLRGAGRSSSFSDIVANVIGTFLGVVVLLIVKKHNN
jgi:VanZ family protein